VAARPEHVVVVGAGITGALTAYELLQAGVRVTVVEAWEKGAGSSSRSAACIRQQWGTPATVRGMRYSVRFYGRMREQFGFPEGTAEVMVPNGYLFLHTDPDRWQTALANVSMQQAAGLAEVEALAPGAVAERFPQVDASALQGATFCPTDGFLRPDVIYGEGFRAVEEAGGVVRQHWEVSEGVTDGQGRLIGVRNDDGDEVLADLVVNATNAWAPRLSEKLGGSSLPIEALKRYLYFVHRSGVDAADMLGWPMTITPSRAYCRPENGDQLLAGWAHTTQSEPEFDWADQDRIEPPFFHKSGLDNYGFRLWMELAEAMPAIGEFSGIEATTAGFYAVTPDHNPILGFDPQQPGLLHAAGFSGHGAMLGPFTAAAIAQMALAGRTLRTVMLDDEEVDLTDLLIGRDYSHAEGMVI